ncbi:MAG: SsrA-binding protein, partial [Hyphomicrobiales bacterium]|nr:SsrA-binding protein [Hyphomicrobiales bacterium]
MTRGSKRLIAENRRARHIYFLEKELEAGLMLVGTEVKSLRAGLVSLDQAYAGEREGELYLFNLYIGEYAQASRENHEP